MTESIYAFPIFADATDDEVQWMLDHSHEVTLQKGDFFFREGEPAHQFYIVMEGELQVTRTVNGERRVVGTTPRGVSAGETFLLTGGTALASARAIEPTRLMVFNMPEFLAIFTHCPAVGLYILRSAAERLHNFAVLANQQEKMAALGKLSAGLAHELNNPAAAAKHSVRNLHSLIPSFQARSIRLNAMGMTEAELEGLIQFIREVQKRADTLPKFSTLEQSEREDELGEWLEQKGVENAWEIAPTFVSEHLIIEELEGIVGLVESPCVPELLAWLYESLSVSSLLYEIEQSTQRISDLVGAIKSYTYMDRGVIQEVDIHKDLDNTLRMLKHRLVNATVMRQYDSELSPIQGRGGELNQVWTNIIANAIEATNGRGTIRLITRNENDYVMVEIADDGPGIPPEIMPRLFEPFFTTKGVGSGTGLGLEISYRVVQQHNGTMEVRSEPGHTRFIVRLPVNANQGDTHEDNDEGGDA
jgi:signal transduction histidine kinase